MIHALDHIALGAQPLDAGVAAYRRLLGRQGDGAAFQLANIKLELRPAVREGLAELAFAVRDLAKARHLLERRALALETDASADGALSIATASTHGVPIALVGRAGDATPRSPLADSDEAAAVNALDHVVVRTPNPERAVALYAGRLGLDLRLDRSEPAWGARLLFFRCGDLIVEVAHDLKAGIGDGPDTFWGLSWRVGDIAAAHARLAAAGIDVSPIRTGRRPGTRVFTVRNQTVSVPTLMIGPG
jgi:catechol 2,3-dioxygenase-like lactoylglutathione lyase family enzyme